jgi:hypothetical protein
MTATTNNSGEAAFEGYNGITLRTKERYALEHDVTTLPQLIPVLVDVNC